MKNVDLPIIDAHHHFWDPTVNYHPWLNDELPIPFRYGDYSSLRQPYMPAQYLRDTGHHRVLKSVYVETEWDPSDPLGEVDWIEQVHAEHDFPHAVVAQAWLDREDAAEVLSQLGGRALVRSIRQKPAASASRAEALRGQAGSMDDSRWRDGFALLQTHGLMFDLQTPWWHFAAALELANDFPNATIILNHCGLPSDRSDAGLDGWHQAMAMLAAAPNVMVKISGIGRAGKAWTVADNAWIVTETIAMFGASRCMFASNFPVDGLCAPFATIFDGFKAIVADMDGATQGALFYDNAARIYDI
jgi:predicted TIM-barrel fold metal-dependent hydrolase